MTIPNFIELQGADRTRFRATAGFLQGRVCERQTIEWALGLGPGHGPERAALTYLIRGSKTVPRAWAATWALIEESWSSPEPDANADTMTSFDISQRLPLAPRSGGLVTLIADHVRPRLTLRSPLHVDGERPKRPTALYHLVTATVTSTDMGSVDDIVGGVREVDDAAFLSSLADALDANVRHALGLARRIGSDHPGLLYRVRYGGVEDDDTYHEGIAPTVKLLHAVILRLAELDPAAAGSFMDVWRWRVRRSTSAFGPSWHTAPTSRLPTKSGVSSKIGTPLSSGMPVGTPRWRRCAPNASATSAPRSGPPSSSGFDDCRPAGSSTEPSEPKSSRGFVPHGPFASSSALSFPAEGCPTTTFAGSKHHFPPTRICAT